MSNFNFQNNLLTSEYFEKGYQEVAEEKLKYLLDRKDIIFDSFEELFIKCEITLRKEAQCELKKTLELERIEKLIFFTKNELEELHHLLNCDASHIQALIENEIINPKEEIKIIFKSGFVFIVNKRQEIFFEDLDSNIQIKVRPSKYQQDIDEKIYVKYKLPVGLFSTELCIESYNTKK